MSGMRRFVFLGVVLLPALLVGAESPRTVLDVLREEMLKDSAGKTIDSLGNAKAMDEACSLAREVKNEGGILLACGTLAFLKITRGEHSEANRIYTYLLKEVGRSSLSERMRKEYVWRLNDMLGFASLESGEYDAAIRYYGQALEAFGRGEYGASQYPAYAHTRIGMAYHRKGEYDRAEEHYRKALKLYGDAGEPVARVYNNLGMLYYERKDYDGALRFLRKALKVLYESVGKDDVRVGYVYSNMADVYEAMGNEAKAEEYRSKAREILEPQHP